MRLLGGTVVVHGAVGWSHPGYLIGSSSAAASAGAVSVSADEEGAIPVVEAAVAVIVGWVCGSNK